MHLFVPGDHDQRNSGLLGHCVDSDYAQASRVEGIDLDLSSENSQRGKEGQQILISNRQDWSRSEIAAAAAIADRLV